MLFYDSLGLFSRMEELGYMMLKAKNGAIKMNLNEAALG